MQEGASAFSRRTFQFLLFVLNHLTSSFQFLVKRKDTNEPHHAPHTGLGLELELELGLGLELELGLGLGLGLGLRLGLGAKGRSYS